MAADPLVGIDSIDWSTLNHAYGSAEDVPDLLKSLRSKDDNERERAYYELQGNIYHQGTRYGASVAAIPFLYALLEAEDTPHRERLLELLMYLAVGFPSSFVSGGMNVTEWRAHIAEISRLREDTVDKESENHGNDSSDESGDGEWDPEEHEYLVQVAGLGTYEAVQKGLSSVHRFLDDSEVAMRAMVAYSLAFFPERFEESRPLLWQRLESEENIVVRGTVLVALAILCNSCLDAESKSSTLRLLSSHCIEESPERFTKWIRALTLIILGFHEPKSIEEVLQRVTNEDYLSDDEPTEDTFPFATSDLLEIVSSILLGIKGTENPYAPRLVAKQLAKSNNDAYETLAEISLNMAFDVSFPKPLPEFADLSEVQQEIIREIWTTSLEEGRKLPYSFQGMFEKWERPTSKDLEDYITLGQHETRD